MGLEKAQGTVWTCVGFTGFATSSLTGGMGGCHLGREGHGQHGGSEFGSRMNMVLTGGN